MRRRLRLLPLMIFAATCLLSIKVVDLADGLLVHVPTLGVGQTMAAGDDPEASEDLSDGVEALSGDVTAEAEPEPSIPTDSPDAEAWSEAEIAAAGGAMAEDGASSQPIVLALGDELPYVTPPLPLGDRNSVVRDPDAPVFTAEELAVLQALSERRDALDAQQALLETRERQLAVAEQRIDEKIAEMGALQVRIEELLTAYEEQEEERILGLVKIYEAMKPKDAAPIFDQLDMDILLEIVIRMSSIRSAPILARMDPLRAQEVTEELARLLQERPDFMADPEAVAGE